MTAKKDLKRRVRERQARTGESYVTARRQVAAKRPAPPEPEPPFPVVEMIDATPTAAALGLACKVSLFPPLAQRVDPARALTRLRDALRATGADPTLDVMRDVAFHARRPTAAITSDTLAETRRFVARLRAGIGGVSARGRMLALHVDTELVVFALWQLWATPIASIASRDPSLIVTSVDGLLIADPITGLAEP
jgi:hypothetical protein